VSATTKSWQSLRRQRDDLTSTVAPSAPLPVVRGAIREQVLGEVARARLDSGGSSTGEIRRSQGDRTGPGTVIAAVVRARLLGLKILTLDAQVVLVPADAASDGTPVASRARVATRGGDRGPDPPHEGQRADLAYAVHLLEEGSKSLDVVRAMRGPQHPASP
jgi:hypothetical protein